MFSMPRLTTPAGAMIPRSTVASAVLGSGLAAGKGSAGGLSTSDKIELAVAITSGVVAVLTLALAVATRQMAVATQGLVREARRDRRLTYQPILTLVGAELADEGRREEITVGNVGVGPAIDVRVMVAHDQRAFAVTAPKSLPPAAAPSASAVYIVEVGELLAHATGEDRSGLPDPQTLLRPPGGGEPRQYAAFCEDVLGARYRFLFSEVPLWEYKGCGCGSTCLGRLPHGPAGRLPLNGCHEA